jgi:hypothetical protein
MMILHLHNSIHNHLFVSIQSIQNLSAIEWKLYLHQREGLKKVN